MRLWIKGCICFSLYALVSCTVSLPPQSQVKNIKNVPTMEHSIKKSLQKKAIFSKGEWPKKQWWLEYNSPELNGLMNQALANNPSIQEIQSRITAARQQAIVTRSQLFPLVFFDAHENRQYLSKNGLYRAFNHKLPLNATVLDLSLSFNFDFDFWGQNRNLFRAAVGEAKVREAEAAEVELVISTAIAQAYFAYKTNLIRQKLYLQLIELNEKITKLQNLLVKKGLSSELPAFEASVNLFETKKLLSSITAELAVDRHLLNILSGQGPDTPVLLSPSLSSKPKTLKIPKVLPIDFIARRPDLIAQIWRAKALAYKTGAAMSEYYPNVNLVGLVGLESTSWRKFLDISSGTAALRPAIHLPVFTAGAIRANIKATKAQFDAAIEAYNNLLLYSTQEVLDVLAFAEDIYQQKREQEHVVEFAKQRYELSYVRQKKGLDSLLDLYFFQEELLQKKLVDVTLLYNQYLASIKLTKALGGGYYQNTIPLVNNS
ncbi:efflux transporter outer membrane subunit [Fluoribacter dumoffii]|uniref:efflux transporter outer membrane subunit n=1 Tax=Fluoribacter dumoffii TaxID=463 RepID=UPI00224354B8|nr:efflux transporter outer membrane subunit [Fluoribacter dumoffii]MCW8418379.1 efflux transporter outer membrane subunit [Fluoribacter dumoffii]MCW8453779.1 efflux transporter outer membrane subunit [Fluoribacter dumoffii]MCW8462150.1 efflux transporter outer membrane subunit [Fluoribacter dumoffii]MCW8482362.1 efflux transporter outer membrane subunit [Fluoribacter dumoffii]